VNESFERSTPLKILEWTFERFNDDVAMACSFEDVALLHMVHQLRPNSEIIFWTRADISPRRSNRVTNRARLVAQHDAHDARCRRRRVALRHRTMLRTSQSRAAREAVTGKSAWITSVKRVDAPSRTNMKTLMWDEKFKLVKVNPLATWTDDDVAYYCRHTTCRAPTVGAGLRVDRVRRVTEKPLVPGP